MALLALHRLLDAMRKVGLSCTSLPDRSQVVTCACWAPFLALKLRGMLTAAVWYSMTACTVKQLSQQHVS